MLKPLAVIVVIAIGAAVVIYADREDQAPERHGNQSVPVDDATGKDSATETQGGSTSATGESPPFIYEIDDETRGRFEVVASEKFFKGGYDESYRRHRIVGIDTLLLKQEVIQAWSASEKGEPSGAIILPLFDDAEIAVQVNSWIGGDKNVTSAYGMVIEDGRALETAKFHFVDDGRMEASFMTHSSSYWVSFVEDATAFIIVESDLPFDID